MGVRRTYSIVSDGKNARCSVVERDAERQRDIIQIIIIVSTIDNASANRIRIGQLYTGCDTAHTGRATCVIRRAVVANGATIVEIDMNIHATSRRGHHVR